MAVMTKNTELPVKSCPRAPDAPPETPPIHGQSWRLGFSKSPFTIICAQVDGIGEFTVDTDTVVLVEMVVDTAVVRETDVETVVVVSVMVSVDVVASGVSVVVSVEIDVLISVAVTV